MTKDDPINLTMMYAAHDAFRRDLDRMAEAGSVGALRDRWQVFSTYLTIHHVSEDETLWPALRSRAGGRPGAAALLAEMQAEHDVLDPLMAGVDAALAHGDLPAALALVRDLGDALRHHLAHEERDCLPLIAELLTPAQWAGFGADQRRRVGASGTGGAGAFLPWLLDGVREDRRREVLAALPPPVRVLFRTVWNPRYHRRAAAVRAGG